MNVCVSENCMKVEFPFFEMSGYKINFFFVPSKEIVKILTDKSLGAVQHFFIWYGIRG